MHERNELPEIDVPRIERELVEIAIDVSRECHPIPAAATIVDGPIEGRELHEGLDHAKRRLGIQARDLFRPEDLVGRRHGRVRAAADRRIEVSQVQAGGQIAPPHGWCDSHERLPLREVRSIVLEAVWPEPVEVLLGSVAPPPVDLHVRPVRPGVGILALRARKAQRPLGDDVPLQRGGCRGPEIEWHADELVARTAAKAAALADAARPRVNPARRIENALEEQVLVNPVEDGFDFRAPFRDEPGRLGLPAGAILLRACRLGGLSLGDVGGLCERRGREVAEDRDNHGCGSATRAGGRAEEFGHANEQGTNSVSERQAARRIPAAASHDRKPGG